MVQVCNAMLFIAGDEKECDVCFCDCISDTRILLSHGLWPISPSKPVFAIEVQLMDLLECLFLESQVSLNSFCSALRWKNILSQKPILVIYLLFNPQIHCILQLGSKALYWNNSALTKHKASFLPKWKKSNKCNIVYLYMVY